MQYGRDERRSKRPMHHSAVADAFPARSLNFQLGTVVSAVALSTRCATFWAYHEFSNQPKPLTIAISFFVCLPDTYRHKHAHPRHDVRGTLTNAWGRAIVGAGALTTRVGETITENPCDPNPHTLAPPVGLFRLVTKRSCAYARSFHHNSTHYFMKTHAEQKHTWARHLSETPT